MKINTTPATPTPAASPRVKPAARSTPPESAQVAAPTPASTKPAAVDAAASAEVSAKEQTDQADKLLKQVEEAVARVRDAVKLRQNSIEFKIDDLPDRQIVVTVRDKDTKEVVRQIPSEEMLRISEALEEGGDAVGDGFLVNGRA
jgi:flagellar protein FlaG